MHYFIFDRYAHLFLEAAQCNSVGPLALPCSCFFVPCSRTEQRQLIKDGGLKALQDSLEVPKSNLAVALHFLKSSGNCHLNISNTTALGRWWVGDMTMNLSSIWAFAMPLVPLTYLSAIVDNAGLLYWIVWFWHQCEEFWLVRYLINIFELHKKYIPVWSVYSITIFHYFFNISWNILIIWCWLYIWCHRWLEHDITVSARIELPYKRPWKVLKSHEFTLQRSWIFFLACHRQ